MKISTTIILILCNLMAASQEIRVFRETDGLYNKMIYAKIYQESSGNICFSGALGINVWNGYFWKFLEPPTFPKNYPKVLPQILSNDSGHVVYRTRLGDSLELNSDYNFDTEIDKEGNLWFRDWIGCAKLYKILGKNWIEMGDLPQPGVLFPDQILRLESQMYIDSKNRVWIPNRKGIFLFSDKKLTNFSKENEIKMSWCSFMEDSDGKLWMSAGGGIYIYDGSKLTHLTKEDGLFSNYVCSTVMDKNGKIWAAHYKGGVSCYDGKNWITYKLFGEFADIDKKFDINKGLAGNLSSQITIGSNEEKFPSKIIVDSLNQIWYAVTGGGLFRFKENKWEMVLSGSDYTSFEMIEDSKGNIWYSEYALAGSKPAAGLFKFDIKEQTWKSIAVVNFRNIFEDRAGNIWGTCPEKKMWGKENICRVSND